jgi:hypothetical protein
MLMTTPYSADTLHPSMGFEWCMNQDFWAKPRWFAGHQLDGECKSARGLKADLRVKVLIQRTIEGSMFEAYSQIFGKQCFAQHCRQGPEPQIGRQPGEV